MPGDSLVGSRLRTPVIKEAIGGIIRDFFSLNNRTRPSRSMTTGESVITSVLKFDGRAQRPPDSSLLRGDTRHALVMTQLPPLGPLPGTGAGTQQITTCHSLGVTPTMSSV